MRSPDALGGDPSGRMVWVDGYRGLAVVVMVWVHVANTLLTAEEQMTEWYGRLTFFHGLVAPAFFWIGGFVRGVRVPQPGGKRPGFGAVKRLLGVMLLGYLMHFPWRVFIHFEWDATSGKEMMTVDVLQTLAFTGLVMVGVERFVITRRMQQWVMGVLAVVFVVLERWAGDWVTSWPFVNAWLSRQTGSVFCLFPWVGFGLAGWLCGSWVVAGRGKAVWIYACIGAMLAWGVPQLEWLGRGEAFFLQRLGWVILVALVVAGVFRMPQGRAGMVSSALLIAGRESLVIYVAHLTIIHAIPSPFGTLEQCLGRRQSLVQVVGWFVFIAAISWGAAWWNERRKERMKGLEVLGG